MPTEAFVARAFQRGSLAIIDQAIAIIDEYAEQGFTLTLRQLYYQFVARDLIANKQSEYKRLGSIINDARLAGLIDWSSIEDRTRNVRTVAAWDSPQSIIHAVAEQYREDLWSGQPQRVEVWIEKDALIGVVEPVCERWRVPFFACRGYTSQSEQYAAGKRFSALLDRGIEPIVLHLGDHDPSGIDMTRDNRDRLSMFAWAPVEVRRLALNFDQVQRYRPPPNPAKETDSRAGSYIERFGAKSWELDALDPRTIDQLISDEISGIVDRSLWNAAAAHEAQNRSILSAVHQQWGVVASTFGDGR
ncbi:hypothetical protein S2M10_07100 [Sphingomonas sp. S2M10]|uniref:hypothetical protein n=1 Tax=Sphingomonas sp. S2M10 TaxID=2705010 RepID=UPI001457217E|nr:hypothetical protein [Sphingomonas sp. S2M10]NLS25740.1 hypothetical protein [Sphingomonas sp. S2M10]